MKVEESYPSNLQPSLPFSSLIFLGKLAEKVTNGDYVIVGCLANGCKCEWVATIT